MRPSLKRLLIATKVVVAVALLGFILWRVDWPRLGESLRQANLPLILFVLACMTANVLVSAYKWKLLLRIHGLPARLRDLARYYFAAFFFNNFLPTTIGGDGYRIYKTATVHGTRARAIVALLMERASGMTAMLLVGLLGGISVYLRTGDRVARFAVIVGVVAALCALALLPAFRPGGIALRWIHARPSLARLRILFDRIGDYWTHPGPTAAVAAISIGFHLFLISFRYLALRAVGADCPLDAMAVIVVVSTVVALVPITLNGLGLMDGSYVFLLAHYGVDYESAVLATFLVRILNLPLSLLGGLAYLADPARPAPEVAPEDEA